MKCRSTKLSQQAYKEGQDKKSPYVSTREQNKKSSGYQKMELYMNTPRNGLTQGHVSAEGMLNMQKLKLPLSH